MSLPRSEVTTNRDDAAGGDTLGFMSMIGSTLNLIGRQDSCQHRPNSSNADGSDVLANIEDAASASSNSQAGGQEVELRDDSVSGGGGLSINRQFDSSSSDASSLPSNGVADANHRQDWRKGWVSICKPNWGSFVKAAGVGVVVACLYAIINNNMKKNALISDLQTEISSLKNKEQQYLLDISQQQQGGGKKEKKGKAGKDECCACLTSSPSTSPSLSPSLSQRDILEILYQATDGDNWDNNAGWLSDSDECTWDRVTCNDSGIVIFLDLFSNNLEGIIPSQIASLSQLGYLDLSDNQLSGPIPSELGGLSQLGYLNFRGNQLTGSIPDQVCALTANANTFFLHADCSVCNISPPTAAAVVEEIDGGKINGNYCMSRNILCGGVRAN